MNPAQRIEHLIQAAIPAAQVDARDPMGDGQHFEAVVISQSFEGMPLVKQHQQVLNALKEEFSGAVHALQVKTYTPEQWSRLKQKEQ